MDANTKQSFKNKQREKEGNTKVNPYLRRSKQTSRPTPFKDAFGNRVSPDGSERLK